MAEQATYPIIDKKRYQKLKRMIHGSDTDRELIRKIFEQIDIKESFLYALALMSQRLDEKKTMGTFLIESKRFYGYIAFLIDSSEDLPVFYDLQWIQKIWVKHCEYWNFEVSNTDTKFLTKEYRPHRLERPRGMIKGGPKMNRRRR